MDLLEKKSWIEELSYWIEQGETSYSHKEMQKLFSDLEIAVTMTDSLVECSGELKRIADLWALKYEKFEANR